MKPRDLIITGASGFIGRHAVRQALLRGHRVTAVGRNKDAMQSMDWAGKVRFVQADLHAPRFDPQCLMPADTMLHLAWPDLSNLKSPAHMDQYFKADARFLERMFAAGIAHTVVTGTCLEYGIQYGPLAETMPCRPTLAYAQAKDALRQGLFERARPDRRLVWARVFYTYGEGQNPKSLLAQLDRAIANGAATFPMSQGEQLRDYLPVEEIARRLLCLIEHPSASGVYNICAGRPISVRRLVEEHIAHRGAAIKPVLGCFSYPDYEALAFWGDGTKFQNEIAEK